MSNVTVKLRSRKPAITQSNETANQSVDYTPQRDRPPCHSLSWMPQLTGREKCTSPKKKEEIVHKSITSDGRSVSLASFHWFLDWVNQWEVSSFLTAHRHIIGHSVLGKSSTVTRNNSLLEKYASIFILGLFEPTRLSGNLRHRQQERHLRSARTGTLFVPRTTTTLGMRSFAVAGPVIWNSLPAALRTATLSPLTFGRHLKAHLFGWSAARLRTIYDALYKSTHHHHHHHHQFIINTSLKRVRETTVCYQRLENWKLFLHNIGSHLLKLFENIAGVWLLNRGVFPSAILQPTTESEREMLKRYSVINN